MSVVVCISNQTRAVLRAYRYDRIAVYITEDDSRTTEGAEWAVLTKGQSTRKYHTDR